MLYPQNTASRTVQSLNGVWDFKLEDNLNLVDVSNPLENPMSMAVPGSYNDQGVVREIRQHDGGSVVYEREFTINKLLMDERLLLRFDAAAHQAWVFVNGEEVTYHKGGFTPFTVEINDYIKPGKNRLTVRVSHILDHTSLPVAFYKEVEREDGRIAHKVSENFDFLNYAGLSRYVRLCTTPWTYLDDITIHYDVDLDALRASVYIESDVVGEFDDVKVTVYDEDNTEVGQGTGINAEVVIEDLKLWNPLAAYHYTAHVEVVKAGQVIDEYYEDFGIRTVEVKGTEFLINGKPFYFKGAGKHEDTYINGRGINEAYNVADVNLLKWLGANSIRTSHYPYSEEMMRLCDKEGIVVIDESPAVGLHEGYSADISKGIPGDKTWDILETREAHEQVMSEMISRDKNLTCVVMWSTMNEPNSGGKGAKEYFQHIFDYSRALDKQNRPFVYVNIGNFGPGNDTCMEVSDVICLNRYYGWYNNVSNLETAEIQFEAELKEWHKRFPDKPIMILEFGADTIAGLHAIDDIPFTEDYQVKYYETNCAVMDKHDYLVGEHVWNFADFETKVGLGRIQGNKKGLFTRAREPKAAARFFRERWNSIPDFGYKG